MLEKVIIFLKNEFFKIVNTLSNNYNIYLPNQWVYYK